MYVEGNGYYKTHLRPPSEFGFKDVTHEWKAEKWEPEKLVALSQRVGAQHFFAMATTTTP